MLRLLFIILTVFASCSLQAQYLNWHQTQGGVNEDEVYAICIDDEGDLLIVGYFEGAVAIATETLISSGDKDFFILKSDIDGNLIWAKSFGGQMEELPFSIATDGSNNIYVTGSFKGTVTFDPGNPSSTIISEGEADIFILKLNSGGDYIWVEAIGGSGNDLGYEVDVEGSQMFLTGFFTDTVDFDPGLGQHMLHSMGNMDAFVLKMDTAANLLWAKGYGGPGADLGIYIEIDAGGNIYTTGEFQQTVDFDPGTDTNLISSNGGWDGFIQKLDANGDFVWTKSISGWDFELCGRALIDGNGSIYLTGVFTDNADLDPGAGTHIVSSEGMYDFYIAKLDANANLIWSVEMGDLEEDLIQNMVLDESNNIVATGSIMRNGHAQLLLLKLNESGQVIWKYETGGNGFDGGYGIAIGEANNIYVGGSFSDTVNFNPVDSINSYTAVSHGNRDGFLMKLSGSGMVSGSPLLQIRSAATLYPNPVHERMHLEFPHPFIDRMSIHSIAGNTVLKKHAFPPGRSISVDVSELIPGLYFVKATSKNGPPYTLHFIKH